MKSAVFILSTTLFLGACSSEPNVVHLRTEKGKKAISTPVNANRILTMEVKGMTCEMGCGGSIRKELKGTGGVARVEFVNFDENKKVQTAKISFDTNKITVDEMVKIVTTMNENQFTVVHTSSEVIESKTTNTSVEEPASDEEEVVKITENSLSLPNVFDILSGFLVQ
jgi:copper chaperone CopZ